MKEKPTYLLHDGALIPYADARLHVLSTTLKYGIGVFEGYRAYYNAEHDELYAFRVDDHNRRLINSSRIAEIDGPTDVAALTDDLMGLIRANDLRTNLHMRVQVLVDADDGKPDDRGPATVFMAAIPMGGYFGKSGLHTCIASWTRLSDRSMPPRVKAIANYQNGRLALLDAKRNGYDAALLMTPEGRVSEGPGYNIFIVRGGELITPPVTEGILEGITRDSVITLAERELKLPVTQRPIDRTELYIADEVFVCGSAAEVTHLASVDRHMVGDGEIGPITAQLQELYQGAVTNSVATELGWAQPVYAGAPVA